MCRSVAPAPLTHSFKLPSTNATASFLPTASGSRINRITGGHFEIYLQPFPGPGDRIPVSTGGGQQVRWARNGSELFYIAADQRLTSVRVTVGASGKLVPGTPVPLFRTEFDSSFMTRQQYVVSPDGQRFLLNAATDAIDPPSITLILNWKGTP